MQVIQGGRRSGKTVNMLESLCNTNNQLLTKLMWALIPDHNHEYDLSYQAKFKAIIMDNLDKDTDELRRLIRDCWTEVPNE